MSNIEMWGGVAGAWEQHAAFVEQHTAPATKRMFERADLQPGESVLELACGPGEIGFAAAKLVGPSGHVLLSDGAPEMIAVAERHAAGVANVDTAVVDLDQIDLPAASFDAVLVRHGLMFAADRAATLRAIFGLLKPGGRLVTATWGRREDNPWIGLLFDAVGAQFGVEFPPPQASSPLSLDQPELLERLLTEAGFTDVHAEAVFSPSHLPSLEAWWQLVPQIAGPLATAMAGMEPAVREQIRERALAAAAEVVRPTDDGQIELGGSIIVAVGVSRSSPHPSA